MGGGYERDSSNDQESIIAIKEAIDLGFTHIDVAEMYGVGHTEELVGEAIKNYDRKKLFITSKVLNTHLKYDDLIKSARDSLRRLQTTYFDLYLIHAPNPEIAIEETMKAMDYLVKESLTKFIGVSNFSVDQLKAAQNCTKNKIVTNQIDYSLLAKNNSKFLANVESEVIPYCRVNDILVTAFRPLAKGLLAKPGFKVLDEIAEKYGKTQAQVALNWVISKQNVVTLVKSSNIDHLKENLGALGWKLEKEDIEKLDRGIK